MNKPDYSRDFTTFMISFISSYEIIVLTPDPDAAAVNPNGVKIILANVLCTFPINSNPIFRNGPKNLPRYPIVLFYSIEFLITLC